MAQPFIHVRSHVADFFQLKATEKGRQRSISPFYTSDQNISAEHDDNMTDAMMSSEFSITTLGNVATAVSYTTSHNFLNVMDFNE